MRFLTGKTVVVLAATLILSATALAGDWCKEYNYGNKKKASSVDARQFTLSSTGRLEVDGRTNGGIKVQGADRSDVLVEACVRAWADTQAEADNLVQTTRIETAGVIRAVNDSEKYNSSVSFRISVPRNTDLMLNAKNGGLSVDGVNGSMDLKTVNGGIKLSNVAGDVKGRTTNGGIKVGLNGIAWTGGGLDLETVNGGVKIGIPANFAANVEAGTVNGSFKSDFPELQLPKKEGKTYYRQNKRVSGAINGGGALIRAVTTNGSVKIYSATARAQ
ncbi:MAG: DUF4097 family beta strand repeat protein [Pyrinomonadaceae bacterium]|nr:DUF4097 family beta strand repeat protein [Pyrinomonadaceae bacterium]